MNNETLFTETQKFKQWWIWALLLGINGWLLLGVYQQVIRGEQFGSYAMSNSSLLLTHTLIILITILFYAVRLTTIVKTDGIYVRFFPVHIQYRHFAWSSLSKAYVRTYNALADYGGYGFRIGLFGKGAAYNISGNKGLQLQFTNGKQLLIGTNQPEQLTEALQQLGQLKPDTSTE